MLLTAGIDVGASAVKVAVVESPPGSGRGRSGARVLGLDLERIRRRETRQVVELAYAEALRRAGVEAADIAYLATTGEAEQVENRTGHFFGMTAHARGAVFLEPGARAALDVGGLHARAIRIDERSKVLGYRMTSQCASGSGQFLENIARYLGVTLDEVGSLSRSAQAPEKISSICAVLAETDVINMVTRGIPVSNILKGIHESMAGRYVRLLRSIQAQGVVLVTGGLAADEGLLASLSAEASSGGLPLEIRSHPDSVHAGSLGAALWGAYRWEVLQKKTGAPA